MNAVEDRSHQEQSAALLYRLQRWFFAVCIVGGTAVTLVSVVANPGYYRPHTDVTSFIAAFATANTFMSQTHVISMIFVSYLLPLGLLAMAWLALHRAPWWATRIRIDFQKLLSWMFLCSNVLRRRKYANKDTVANSDIAALRSHRRSILSLARAHSRLHCP